VQSITTLHTQTSSWGTEPICIHSFMLLSIRHSAYFRGLLIRLP
jgi:hypothetical protein